jgi:hypothetical protein
MVVKHIDVHANKDLLEMELHVQMQHQVIVFFVGHDNKNIKYAKILENHFNCYFDLFFF